MFFLDKTQMNSRTRDAVVTFSALYDVHLPVPVERRINKYLQAGIINAVGGSYQLRGTVRLDDGHVVAHGIRTTRPRPCLLVPVRCRGH